MHPIRRRRLALLSLSCVMLLLSGVLATSSTAAAAERPDVLFVAVDDLNDWVGCLGGHPQSKTPNIDRLAARGMLFTNAHCNASLCNPSRASVMTGTLPSTNGVHGNQQDWRQSPYLQGHKTLPQAFREAGYWTGACGKIYHANHGAECGALNGGHGGLRGFNHPASWTARFPSHAQQLPQLAVPTGRNFNGLDIWHWDWGPIDVPVAATEDGQAAEWAVQQLAGQPKDEPLFLAVGLYAPHGPWYCPPAYFDEHPLANVQLPPLNPEDDLDDTPAVAKGFLRNPQHHHAEVLGNDLYDDAVQAYLAQITFADAMLGRVIDALDKRGADDTIVVLWSDHGWHLGEKQKWHKGTNWEEGTRVPLIVVAPGIAPPGSTCAEPVSLVDLYPTLLDLCALPAGEGLDGHSLKPQLLDPTTPTAGPAYTVNGGRHQSVRSKRWRYIRYGDGSEELYDHDADPTEYTNLAGDPQYDDIKEDLVAAFPDEIRRSDETNVVRFGPDGEPTELADEPGFRPIFNGYDLTTWEGAPELWRVENGAIVGETTRDNQLEANTFLVWRGAQPANFELRLRFRVVGDNNSGVQYRSKSLPERGEWAIGGYQADLHPAADLLGMVYEEQGRRIIARRGQQVVVTPEGRKLLAGTFENVVDADAQSFDLSSWHELIIIADANRLVHKLNGEVVAEVWDHEAEARSKRGLIALQLHRGAKMRAEFRDLRMRDLPPRPLFAADHIPLPSDAAEVNGRPGR
jgi:arylsulfatase A-like enzyme